MTQLGRGLHGRRSGAIAGRGSFAALDKGWPLPANRALIWVILDVLCVA
jgi:hypothetical protein